MSAKYVLGADKTVRLTDDLMEWAQSFETGERQVGRTMIGDAVISTVFLGIDHGFCGGPPVLFETMIFGGSHDQYQTRCSTWEQAENMHVAAIALVNGILPPEPPK
jgi:hypothetical protein